VGKADDVLNSQSMDLTSSTKWSHSKRFFSRYAIQGIHDRFRNYRYRLILGAFAGNDFIWKISSGAEFTQLSSLNLDLSDTSHIIGRFELNLAAAIASGWALKISLIKKYDSAPETEGVKKNDLTFLTNISWKF
jgi:putative salt-induced outer membrane protein YdiY